MSRVRRIALAVRNWGSMETVHAWNWTKRHLLQGSEFDDRLYIVHVTTSKQSGNNWRSGGPVLPELDRALQSHSYDICELQGETAGSTLVQFAQDLDIDLLIIGCREHKSSFHGNTTDYIANHAKRPCLVVQAKPSAGDSSRLKLLHAEDTAAAGPQSSGSVREEERRGIGGTGGGGGGAGGGAGPSMQGREEERRVAVAYDSAEGGQQLLQWATQNCLQAHDTIFVLQLSGQHAPKLLGRVKGSRINRSTNLSDLSQQHLEGYSQVSDEVITGNPKSKLRDFVERNMIDLLIILRTQRHRIRKALLIGGSSVSSYLSLKGACPCLIVPIQDRRGNNSLDGELVMPTAAAELGDIPHCATSPIAAAAAAAASSSAAAAAEVQRAASPSAAALQARLPLREYGSADLAAAQDLWLNSASRAAAQLLPAVAPPEVDLRCDSAHMAPLSDVELHTTASAPLPLTFSPLRREAGPANSAAAAGPFSAAAAPVAAEPGGVGAAAPKEPAAAPAGEGAPAQQVQRAGAEGAALEASARAGTSSASGRYTVRSDSFYSDATSRTADTQQELGSQEDIVNTAAQPLQQPRQQGSLDVHSLEQVVCRLLQQLQERDREILSLQERLRVLEGGAGAGGPAPSAPAAPLHHNS